MVWKIFHLIQLDEPIIVHRVGSARRFELRRTDRRRPRCMTNLWRPKGRWRLL